ncbi:MAG: hypothetical protein IPH57_05750 [Saprospiraceae bacterium]|nr:hypothetical protein [Saprospiraceae bacterium]
MNKLVNIIYVLFIFVIISCCDSKCIEGYNFDVPLEISPLESTIHVGDTLYVRMITNNQALKETYGNRIVKFPDFDPNAIFNLPVIDTFPVKEGFLLNKLIVDTSIYDTQIGHTEHLGLGLFFFDIPNDEYESRIEFRVVMNTPGNYMLVCRDGIFFTDRNKEIKFPDTCGHDGDLSVHYNISQGSHENILKENHFKVLDEYWKNSEGDKDLSDKYYFKVEE